MTVRYVCDNCGKTEGPWVYETRPNHRNPPLEWRLVGKQKNWAFVGKVFDACSTVCREALQAEVDHDGRLPI